MLLPFQEGKLKRFHERYRELLPLTLEAVRLGGGWDVPLLEIEKQAHPYNDTVDEAINELDRVCGEHQPQVSVPSSANLVCTLRVMSPDSASVSERGIAVLVHGRKRVWLLKTVFDAGRIVTWQELVHADLANAGQILERRCEATRRSGRLPVTPKLTQSCRSMQNLGSRIRKDLRQLAYHWNQDGHGVIWSADCK